MGFFSKIFKGVKKVFKSIGKRIKKIAKGVGKFMGKIGIVGQIAMSFILPGIGGALLKTLGGTLGKVAAWAAAPGGNALIQGAKAVIGTATKFVTQTARAFNTVTSGVKSFLSETVKTAVNKIPGINVEGAANNFFGTGGAFERVAGTVSSTWDNTIGSTNWMKQFDPLAGAKQTQAQITDIVSESTGLQPKPQQVGDFDLNIESPLPEDFKFGSKLPEGYVPVDTVQMPDTTSLLDKTPPAPALNTETYQQQLKSGLIDTGATAGGLPTEDTGFRFFEAGTGVEKSGINLTGEAVTTGAAQALEAYTTPTETGYGGESSYSPAPMLLGQYDVQEAAPLPQFGFPMYQFDIAQPGDAYYRPLSSWKRSMGVA